jgi:DNA polymerase-2
VFSDEPYETWLQEVTRDLLRGALDAELSYTKILRQGLDDYASEGAPPHVRAARLRLGEDQREKEITYVMTTQGPKPAGDAGEGAAPIDHGHYLEKQLAPACDVVLTLLGTSFEKIAGPQGSLF